MSQSGAHKLPSRSKTPYARTTNGCSTCRRRRVKCGAERPECIRCQKMGERCGGYAAADLAQLQRNGPTNPQDLFNRTIPPTLDLRYGSAEQAKCLSFYLSRTGPMASMASPVKDLWTIVIPQASWKCIPIKQMLCALSLLDRNWHKDTTQEFEAVEFANAVARYDTALRTFAYTEDTDLSNAILLSVMAWCFDVSTNNHCGADLHKQASKAMLAQIQSKDSSVAVADQVVVERAECSIMQGNLIYGRIKVRSFHVDSLFADLQESRRELYRIATCFPSPESRSSNEWEQIWQSLDDWRMKFESLRHMGLGTLPQIRALSLAQNTVSTYLSLLDPSPVRESWEQEREFTLVLNNLEQIMSCNNGLNDLRWIFRLLLLTISNLAKKLDHVMARVFRLQRSIESSASNAQSHLNEPNFFVEVESIIALQGSVTTQFENPVDLSASSEMRQIDAVVAWF